jgi:DHA2 family multidrug resistance protein
VSQAILVESFPRQKQGLAMAAYGMGVVVAPIIGPTLGGWLTDNYTWRWIFFINIPVGILSLLLTSALVDDPPYLIRKALKQLRIDYIGLGLLAVGLGFLQLVLDKGQRDDWFESRFITACTVLAVVGLIGVVVWELWLAKEPVIDIRLLKDRNFFSANILMFTLGFVLYASTMLIPVFLQTLLGYTATMSGLVLSPGGFITLFMLPVAGLLLPRVGPAWLITVGLIAGAASLFYLAGINLQVDYMSMVIARCFQTFGLAFLFVPINAAAFMFISRQHMSNATGIINLARNIGGSAGVSFVTTMLARRAQYHQSVLVNHVTQYDYGVLAFFQRAGGFLVGRGSSPTHAADQAHGLGNLLVQQQATMLAFIDNFWLLGVLFIALVPLALSLKRAAPGQAMPMGPV